MRFRFHHAIQKPGLLAQIHRLGFIEGRHFGYGDTRVRQCFDCRSQIFRPVTDVRTERKIRYGLSHFSPGEFFPRQFSGLHRAENAGANLRHYFGSAISGFG
jgi:hypothetical protein